MAYTDSDIDGLIKAEAGEREYRQGEVQREMEYLETRLSKRISYVEKRLSELEKPQPEAEAESKEKY